MKYHLTALVAILALAGCTTPKTRLLNGAHTIKAMNTRTSELHECKLVDSAVLVDRHPNNLQKEVKNETFLLGGTHYKIVSVTSQNFRGRDTGYIFDIYSCSLGYK